MRKNKRAARAARTYEQVRAFLYRFDDNLCIQPYIFNSVYLI